MTRWLKTLLIVVAALVGLVAVGVAIIVATFDPQTYKPLLIERVHKGWQRTLAIPGPVRMSFFPRLGVQVGEWSLSERGQAEPFASARSARVSLALWPLLRQQVIIDRVQIDGLRARVVRHADGRSSIDDLLGAPADPAVQAPGGDPTPLAVDIAGLSVRDAAIAFDDRANRRQLALSGIEIDTGRLASGVPSDMTVKGRLKADRPALDLDIGLQGRLTMDFAARRHAWRDLSLTLAGKAAGQAGVSLKLGAAVVADLAAGEVAVSGLTVDGSWPRTTGGPLQLAASGSASVQLARKTAAAKLSGTLDGARFDAKLGMPRFAPAAFEVDLSIDRIDADRHLAAVAAASPGQEAAKAEPLDLTALRGIEATGQLRIAALQAAKLQIGNVRMGLRAAGGRLDLSPIQADLYSGSAAGRLTVDARASVPRVTARQTLTGVQIGPLLKDAMGRDSLEGRGNVSLDVASQGGTTSALIGALSGDARLELRDGALRGLNVAQAIRTARARLGGAAGEQTGAGSSAEKTDFSELTASFRIDRGIARNDDLLVKSPLLRITGNGDIDLGARRIDYLVKATVVSTLHGQGGPELQALSGQTVPVRLSGPLDAIGWRIDFAAMAKEAAKAKVEERKQEVKEKLREKIGGALKDLFGK